MSRPPHSDVTTSFLVDGQLQTVCLEVLKDDPQAGQRGERIETDVQMLEIRYNDAGIRVTNLNVAGGECRIQPVPLGRKTADADIMAQSIGQLLCQIIAKAVHILG